MIGSAADHQVLSATLRHLSSLHCTEPGWLLELASPHLGERVGVLEAVFSLAWDLGPTSIAGEGLPTLLGHTMARGGWPDSVSATLLEVLQASPAEVLVDHPGVGVGIARCWPRLQGSLRCAEDGWVGELLSDLTCGKKSSSGRLGVDGTTRLEAFWRVDDFLQGGDNAKFWQAVEAQGDMAPRTLAVLLQGLAATAAVHEREHKPAPAVVDNAIAECSARILRRPEWCTLELVVGDQDLKAENSAVLGGGGSTEEAEHKAWVLHMVLRVLQARVEARDCSCC